SNLTSKPASCVATHSRSMIAAAAETARIAGKAPTKRLSRITQLATTLGVARFGRGGTSCSPAPPRGQRLGKTTARDDHRPGGRHPEPEGSPGRRGRATRWVGGRGERVPPPKDGALVAR